MFGLGTAAGILLRVVGCISGLGDAIVVVVAVVVVVVVPLLVGGVPLPSLLEVSPRGVSVCDVLPPALLLVLPPRFIILPRTPTISAASSKLSSSIPSCDLYTSAMACFASRREAVGSWRQSYI